MSHFVFSLFSYFSECYGHQTNFPRCLFPFLNFLKLAEFSPLKLIFKISLTDEETFRYWSSFDYVLLLDLVIRADG